MEVELLEIRQFLQQIPPFERLPDEALDQLCTQLQITYVRRGRPFPPYENKFYVLRSGAVKLCAKEAEVCEQLAEGGMHASGCALLTTGEYAYGEAIEDTLLYMVDCDVLYRLSQQSAEFGEYFSASLRERLKGAIAALSDDHPAELVNNQAVSKVLRQSPVCIDVSQSIQAAAQLMTERSVGSVLITQADKLVGIVTDRDIRIRCVAEGLPVNCTVDEIMTTDPHPITADTSISNALLEMTRLGVNHLPVLKGDQPIGMFTATDVVLNQGGNAALLAGAIARAHNLEELIECSSRIPMLHHHLVRGGASVAQIGETLSHMTDAISVRLLQFAEQKFGPPPVPYVWLAGGSQGRLEQSSHSDQDNALLLSDEVQPQHIEYFAMLARSVNDGLNACGYVYCPGEAMASNPEWRQPLRRWIEYFDRWILSPEPMALMLSSIWFDLRPVHGDLSLFEHMQHQVLGKARENRFFLAYMMANALKHRPPLGFFRQFVLVHDGQHNASLDLKHSGIVPVTDIARVLSLAGGIGAVNTLERLRAATEAELISEDMAENLADALELIAGLRVRHQAEQIERNIKADNLLDPNDLSSLERGHLKDAFRVIQLQQEVMMKRYGADNLR